MLSSAGYSIRNSISGINNNAVASRYIKICEFENQSRDSFSKILYTIIKETHNFLPVKQSLVNDYIHE